MNKKSILLLGICLQLLAFSPVNGQTESDQAVNDTTFVVSEPQQTLLSQHDVTGSAVSLDSADFNKGYVVSPWELILGKVAGLQITSNSGAPGTDFTIVNRGETSLFTNSAPLVVVDGMVLGTIQPDINPNDIAGITVLKGASAVAIYGERAANGAIIITTKQGGERLKVTYSGQLGLSVLPRKIPVFSADKFRDLVNTYYSDTPAITSQLGTAHTDWQKEIYRAATVQDHHISVSGKANTVPFRLALGNTHQNGIVKTSLYDRTTASLTLRPSLLDQHLMIDVNANGVFNNNRVPDENIVKNAAIFDPTQPIKNGSPYGGYFAWLDSNNGNLPNVMAPANPVAQLKEEDRRVKTNRLIGNVKFDYRLHFLPDMHAVLNYGVDQTSNKTRTVTDPESALNYAYGHEGGIVNNHETTNNQELDVYLNYNTSLNDGPNTLDMIAGYTSVKQSHKNSHFVTTNQNPPRPSGSYDVSLDDNMNSLYLRMNYALLDKYALNVSLRRDGASFYSGNNKHTLSVISAFHWDIKQENFLRNSHTFSDLNFRLSYASTGAHWPFPNSFYYYNISSNIDHSRLNSLETGFDFKLTQSKIQGSVDFYIKTTNKDLLQLPNPLNYRIIVNGGKIKNTGVEFTVSVPVISTNDWQWQASVNGSLNTNVIKKLNSSSTIYDSFGNEIASYSGLYDNPDKFQRIQSVGHPVNTFFVRQQIYDNNGIPLAGQFATHNTVDHNIPDYWNYTDYYYHKHAAPTVMMGLQSIVHHGEWDFSFSGRLQLGNYVYNNVDMDSYYRNLYSYRDYLRNISTAVNDSHFENYSYASDYYVQNAGFFRMDYISLGRTFHHVSESRLNLHLAANIQNAFVISGYKGQDPELASGVDNYMYPRARTFSLSVKVSY